MGVGGHAFLSDREPLFRAKERAMREQGERNLHRGEKGMTEPTPNGVRYRI